MKHFTKILTAIVLSLSIVTCFAGCGKKTDFTVGICQLVQHEALDAATRGFQDALQDAMDKAGKTIKFDLQNAQGDTATCATIANSFVSQNVDLIMANATPALQAMSNATVKIPILGTSVTEYGVALGIDDFTGTVGSNVSGTSDLAPLDKQAQMIFDFFPSATKVGIVYCSAEANSKYQVDVIEQEIKKIKQGVTVTKYSFTDSNDLSAVVTTAKNNSDVIYIPTDNTAASNAEQISSICSGAVPIIAGEEGLCKLCGVATLSIDYYNLGRTTGNMAAKILLEGADISKMAIEYDQNPVFKYNETLCNSFSVNVPQNYVKIAD